MKILSRLRSKIKDIRTTKAIGTTITRLASAFDEELFAKSESELEESWFFRWDQKATLEQNIYSFWDMLSLYEKSVSRWEEHHNGSVCIVERVRDKYLWPKIKEFASHLRQHNWQPFERFDIEPNEGWCWIIYKGRIVESYRDHNGQMLFYPNSANCYMRECITHAKPIIRPDIPEHLNEKQ
jgi:hypothetical protein